MKSKYSITDEDHIYYDIIDEAESEFSSFSKWISGICKCKIEDNSVKVNDSVLKFNSNRHGIISFDLNGRSYDFWWDGKSDNESVKEKIKELLEL